MTRPQNAPGCYGVGIASMKSPVCKECAAREGCAERAVENLQLASETVDVTDYLAVHGLAPKHKGEMPRHYLAKVKVRKATQQELSMFTTMPAKARSIAESLVKKNICLHTSLSTNQNPFNTNKPQYLKPVFDMILNSGAVSRRSIIDAIRLSGSSAATQRSQLSTAIGLLEGTGVLIRDGAENYKVANRDI